MALYPGILVMLLFMLSPVVSLWHHRSQKHKCWEEKKSIGISSCLYEGVHALRALQNTDIIFAGDSILRQVFHTLVNGNLRGMPVIVDAVYGASSYFASHFQHHKDPVIYDSLTAHGKGAAQKLEDLELRQPPKWWSPHNGTVISYSFQQQCVQQLEFVQRLVATEERMNRSKMPEDNGLQIRKKILVLNVGATNVFGRPEQVACLSNALPMVLNDLLKYFERVVIMNQPISTTRLKGISISRLEAVNNAVSLLLQKLNKRNDRCNHLESSDFCTASLLDFRNLAEKSFNSSSSYSFSAPDDVRFGPLQEDDLHYGCMWGSVGKGRMSFPWGSSNYIGYTPAFLRGLRRVDRVGSTDGVGGSDDDARGGQQRNEGPACSYPCGGDTLRALAGSLLNTIIQGNNFHIGHRKKATAPARYDGKRSSWFLPTLSRSSNTTVNYPSSRKHHHHHHQYEVLACHPSYEAIPCPLYPFPFHDISLSSINWTDATLQEATFSTNLVRSWEGKQCQAPGVRIETNIGSTGTGIDRSGLLQSCSDRRATLRDRFAEQNAERFRQALKAASQASVSPSSSKTPSMIFEEWKYEFENGGFSGCRSAPEHVRFVGEEWCRPALSGPGGNFTAANTEHHQEPSKQYEGNDFSGKIKNQFADEVTAQPLGYWCSLPKAGVFHLNRTPVLSRFSKKHKRTRAEGRRSELDFL